LSFGSYWLVAPDFDALSPAAGIFVDWLIAEIKAEVEAL
jgi:hypothetical protein